MEELKLVYCFLDPVITSVIPRTGSLNLQVNQGLTVYGNKGSTDQHA